MKPKILVSFAYMTKDLWLVMRQTMDVVDYMIDSGAFSLFTKAASPRKVNLETYCKLLEIIADKVQNYIQLDVIKDKEATIRNYHKMVHRGFSPMPVYTQDMTLDDFDRFGLQGLNPYVCCAGGVGDKTLPYLRRIDELHAHLGGRCRLHGLGFTRKANEFMQLRTKLHSADSGAVFAHARYGVITMFDRVKGLRAMKMDDLYKKKQTGISEPFRRYFNDTGFRLEWMNDRRANRYVEGQEPFVGKITIDSWLRLMKFYHSRGFHLFLVVASLNQFVALAEVMRSRSPIGVDWTKARSLSENSRNTKNDPAAVADHLKEGCVRFAQQDY